MQPLARLSLLSVPLLALLAPGARAQDIELHHAGGVVAKTLRYDLQDTTLAGTFFLVLPSISEGPVPAGAFLLDVGTELIQAAMVGTYDGSGAGQVTYAVPPNPALAGTTLFGQALTFEFVPDFTVSGISNRVQVTFDVAGDIHNTVEPMLEARRASAVVVPTDCRPIGAGGQTPTSPVGYLSSIEVYDAQLEEFQLVGHLLEKRAHSSATLLDDGRILFVGGVGPGSNVLASCELYDPTSRTSTSTGRLNQARAFHTATKLPDGRVLVVGGSSQFNDAQPLGTPQSVQTSLRRTTEVFDPGTGTWTLGPTLGFGRTMHKTSVLASGKLLITGGVVRPIFGPSSTTADCRYYMPAAAPATGMLLPAPNLPAPRAMHAQTATEDGDALVVGGSNLDFLSPLASGTSTTFVFDAGGESWSLGPVTSGVYTCQDLICVPSKHPLAPPPSYLTAGGWSSLDLATGAGVVETAVTEISNDLSSAAEVGQLTKERLGVRLAPADAGFRVLILGAGPSPVGQPDTTADLYVRP